MEVKAFKTLLKNILKGLILLKKYNIFLIPEIRKD